MPFKPLKFNKPRMYKRRPRTRKRMPFTKNQTKAIHKIAQQSGEMKQIQGTSTDSSLVDGSHFNHSFLTIAKGDDDNQRIGDKINVKDLHYKAVVNSGTASGVCRVIIYQLLRRPETTAETGVGIAGLLPNDFYPNNEDVPVKYKILYDKIFYVNSVSKPQHLINVRIPARKLAIKQLEWDADTGASAELLSGFISMCISTTNTTVSQMTVDSNLKIRYYDA